MTIYKVKEVRLQWLNFHAGDEKPLFRTLKVKFIGENEVHEISAYCSDMSLEVTGIDCQLIDMGGE